MTISKNANSESILAAVLKSLDDDKAEEVVQISLAGKSAMADHMVIASGRSTRQVGALRALAEGVGVDSAALDLHDLAVDLRRQRTGVDAVHVVDALGATDLDVGVRFLAGLRGGDGGEGEQR